MSSLTGRKPKDTYPWLLQCGAGGALTGAPRAICLGDGSATPLSLTSTGILMNGSLVAIDSAVVHNTGTETIAGAKSFSGQMELTGQAATNGTSAMTRDLARLDALTNDVRQWMMASQLYTLAAAGQIGMSGGSATPGDVLVDSGATAGGLSMLRWASTNSIGAMFSMAGDHDQIVRFSDRRIRAAMKVWIEPGMLTGDAIGRFWTSEAYNKTSASDPATPGFGFKLTPSGFVLQIRNSSTLYTAAAVTMPVLSLTGIGHLVELDYTVSGGTGTLNGKVNGVAMTSVSAASMPNSTAANSSPYLQASNTTTGRARFVVRDIRSLVTPS